MRGLLVATLAAGLLIGCSSEKPKASPGDPEPPRQPCESSEDCDTSNPCKLVSCPVGFCAYFDVDDGLPCDDGDACTEDGVCTTGECVSSVVQCASVGDACNDGVCDSASGCEAVPKVDGTACDDADPCTTGDQCVDGSCTAAATDCSHLDNDCQLGACDGATGACVAQAINEGGDCDDGLFCTAATTCDAGACLGTARDCSSVADQCNDAGCNETTDACEPLPIREGLGCNDGLFCTVNEVCTAGACDGGLRNCSAVGNQCNDGTCDEVADACVPTPAREGQGCDDGAFCTENELCNGGVCGGGDPIDCGDTDPCTDDSCDDVANACRHDPIPPIPGAEGPPGDFTCGNGDDDDCDGAADLLDLNCQACADEAGTGQPSADCDDGNDCTLDLCTAAFACDNQALTGNGCDDGFACTENDTCDAGRCGGDDVDCSSLDDTCNAGQCSESIGGCGTVAANEGGNCTTGAYCVVSETCQSGSCLGDPRDCSGAGDDCNEGLCDEGTDACYASPRADGIDCTVDQCTTGATCTAGACGGGSAVVCDDGDACTSDSCNGALGCQTAPVTIDAGSAVAATSWDPTAACLVAGSGARLLVWADVRDTRGLPLAGATVRIGGTLATESANQTGIYWLEVVAAAIPGSESLDVTVDACGDNVTLTDGVAVTYADANGNSEGTGGCPQLDGNLRVRVIAEENGAALTGAVVLVGPSEVNLEHAPEALFGGGASPSSSAVTGVNGEVAFYDYGSTLMAPVAVTVGAAGRGYVTLIDDSASDVILALPLLPPAAPPAQTRYEGTGTADMVGGFLDFSLDAGIVAREFDIDFLAGFRLDALLARYKCWDSGNGNIGTTSLPGNVWIPAQSITFGGSYSESRWQLWLDDGDTADLELVTGYAPALDVIGIINGGGGLADVLSILALNRVGFQLGESVPTPPTDDENISAQSTYPHTLDILYAGQPTETDVVGAAVGDYDGQDGTGELFLIGTGSHAWNDPGSTVSMTHSGLNGQSAPASYRRLASVTALFLDSDAHASIPANRLDATSTILIRENASGGEPFGASDATITVSSLLSSFLDLSGVTWAAGDEARWQNATRNGNAPQFSIHELVVRRLRRMPVLPCDPGRNEEIAYDRLQWRVIKPFGVSCGTEECFTLPVLPAGFPSANSDATKRSGFEGIVGTGNPCTAGTCAAGEGCVDPDLDGANFMCMGGAGTEADPYFTERYVWRVHVYDLELAPAFDFDDFDFSTRRTTMTHESNNEMAIP